MGGEWFDLVRLRFCRPPATAKAITRPDISFLPTPNGTLRIRDSGGNGPAIMFACDPPNVLEHYDATISSLSSYYRVICVELPGFGFSFPKRDFKFTTQDYADTVAYIIAKLDSKPITLMFPCAWGYVAFKVATAHHDLVNRLIICQCPCVEEERAWIKQVDSTKIIGVPLLGQLLFALGKNPVSAVWYGRALPKGQSKARFYGPTKKVLSNGGLYWLASMVQAWQREDPVFAPVDQPTLVLWGSADRTHRADTPKSVFQYLKRGYLVTLADAGHFPELEDPERFKTLLLDTELWSKIENIQP